MPTLTLCRTTVTFPQPMVAVITNNAGYNGMTQRIDDSVFPPQIREIVREKVDLEDAILGEASACWKRWRAKARDEHQPHPDAGQRFIADTMNEYNMACKQPRRRGVLVCLQRLDPRRSRPCPHRPGRASRRADHADAAGSGRAGQAGGRPGGPVRSHRRPPHHPRWRSPHRRHRDPRVPAASTTSATSPAMSPPAAPTSPRTTTPASTSPRSASSRT